MHTRSGLNCGAPSPVCWPLLRDFVDLYMALGDEWARRAVRELYLNPPHLSIDAGESGAAAYAGFLACMQSRDIKDRLGLDGSSRVLVVNTEGITDQASWDEITKEQQQQQPRPRL